MGAARKVVERAQNKIHYRILHLPIWLWVFFILPGNLTYDLYLHGPEQRHWLWLALVSAVCAWRGLAGRLPGVEPQPYVTHYGLDLPNLPYRIVCYTAAWIAILVPFLLNFIGLVIASATGRWVLAELYTRLYYPLALAVVVGTLLDWTPRARRSTIREGEEKAWFYVGIWTVVPAQIVAWAAWRLGGRFDLADLSLSRLRFLMFIAVAALFLLLALREKLPRTRRHYIRRANSRSAAEPEPGSLGTLASAAKSQENPKRDKMIT